MKLDKKNNSLLVDVDLTVGNNRIVLVFIVVQPIVDCKK
jgi:hypothetical protein